MTFYEISRRILKTNCGSYYYFMGQSFDNRLDFDMAVMKWYDESPFIEELKQDYLMLECRKDNWFITTYLTSLLELPRTHSVCHFLKEGETSFAKYQLFNGGEFFQRDGVGFKNKDDAEKVLDYFNSKLIMNVLCQ